MTNFQGAKQPHRLSTVTRAPHQVQRSPRVISLVAVTPSPLRRSSTISKRKNAKITTSHGQCGGTLTCRDTNSCANSSCGSQKQEKASTNFKHPFRYEKESRCDPDTKPGKGNWSVVRNTQEHEGNMVSRVQHGVFGFRNARKTANGVRSSKQPIKTKTATIPRRSWRSHTWLELRAVQPKSAGLYKQSLQEFMEWANNNGRRLVEDNEVDDALVNYMNEKFSAGVQAHVGERLMAGLMSEVTEFSKTGRRTTPTAWRSLRGWRRLCPSRSRRPCPLPVSAAMANELTAGVQTYGGCPRVEVAGVFETWRADTTPQSELDWGEERGLG